MVADNGEGGEGRREERDVCEMGVLVVSTEHPPSFFIKKI